MLLVEQRYCNFSFLFSGKRCVKIEQSKLEPCPVSLSSVFGQDTSETNGCHDFNAGRNNPAMDQHIPSREE